MNYDWYDYDEIDEEDEEYNELDTIKKICPNCGKVFYTYRDIVFDKPKCRKEFYAKVDYASILKNPSEKYKKHLKKAYGIKL